MSARKKPQHGNVGRRNAAKEVRKSGRICFRCLPEIEELAKQTAEARGVSVSDLLATLIYDAARVDG